MKLIGVVRPSSVRRRRVISQIYYTTGSLIKAKVDPMLKRANYEKQLVMLEDALSVADMYVNKYLPDVDGDEDYEPSKTISKLETPYFLSPVSFFIRRRQYGTFVSASCRAFVPK